MNRRTFLKESSMATAGIVAAGTQGVAASARFGAQPSNGSTIQIDPTPRFELSPYLYMQFMEPLGATDGSVEAAWDHVPRRLARGCGGDHTRPRADDDAMGRHLRGFLSLAGRRRTAQQRVLRW